MEALVAVGLGVRGGLKEDGQEPGAPAASGMSRPAVPVRARRLLARSFPRSRTKTPRGAPVLASRRPHPALRFARTSPRRSRKLCNNFPRSWRARRGERRETRRPSPQGPEMPPSTSPPGPGAALLAPPVPARAPGCPRGRGGRSTRFPPPPPPPPLPAEKETGSSSPAAGRAAPGRGGPGAEAAPGAAGAGTAGAAAGAAAGGRGRASWRRRECPRASCVPSRAPREQPPSRGGRTRARRGRRPGARASSPAPRPDTCAASSRARRLALRPGSQAACGARSPGRSATHPREKAAPTHCSRAHFPLCSISRIFHFPFDFQNSLLGEVYPSPHPYPRQNPYFLRPSGIRLKK